MAIGNISRGGGGRHGAAMTKEEKLGAAQHTPAGPVTVLEDLPLSTWRTPTPATITGGPEPQHRHRGTTVSSSSAASTPVTIMKDRRLLSHTTL